MKTHSNLLSVSAGLVIAACAGVPDSSAMEPPPKGTLVIAGGGLSADTEAVWTSFITAAKDDGPIVIVPSASGAPVESAQSVRDTLERYGVAPDRIEVAKLAIMDDRSTPDTDESEWRANIGRPETVALFEQAAAVWFTGGDQSRTTELFLSEEGAATSALQAIRRSNSDGMPIGGTSAGAAIMSDPMITQGDSLTALTGSPSGEPMGLGHGLGFFDYGLVDQHFGERARLGRLVVALMDLDEPAARVGFGVDEDTALIAQSDGWVGVEGNGYVTIVDARGARQDTTASGAVQITGLTLHLMAQGDRFDASLPGLNPADWKQATVGAEYFANAQLGGGGMAIPGQALANVIGDGLIDNAQSQSIERVSFDGRGRGVAYVFTQLPESAGYWGRGPDGEGRYAISNIRFDILPVQLTIETLK